MPTKIAHLEAILFMTTDPLSLDELQKNVRGRKDEIERLLAVLKARYENDESGIRLSETGGYRLIVKPEYAEKVSHLAEHADLSRGLLRVLSIIAYHEPVPQSEIVKIVGNRTYEYVKELTERGLVKAEKKSRTRLLSTTKHFEEYFGARREEFKQLAQEAKQEEKRKPEQVPQTAEAPETGPEEGS